MSRVFALFTTLLFVAGFSTANVNAQIPTSIPVMLPVHGYQVIDADRRLILVDTFSGEIRVLDEKIDVPQSIDYPRWNLQGDRVAYNIRLDVTIIAPFAPDQSKITIPDDRALPTFHIEDWSPAGEYLLGIGIDPAGSYYYDLQTLSLTDNSRTVLRRDLMNEPLNENPQLEFWSMGIADWNPMFDQWIAVQISTLLVGTELWEERPGVNILLVFNRITGEKHIVNDLLPHPIFIVPPRVWSPDGKHLVIDTIDEGYKGRVRTQIVSVLDANGNWEFHLGSSIPEPIERILRPIGVIDWLGVSDLFLVIEHDQTTSDKIYSIAQIIGDKLHVTEFFRVPVPPFRTKNPYSSIGNGSWNLTADPEERYALSCLFDQALSIGTRARVNFTNGTPLRLRTEPGFDAPEITQMPEGTAFEVIGGPACVNADHYYRFWQIELDDGITGWAAEVNNSEYFIEPLP